MAEKNRTLVFVATPVGSPNAKNLRNLSRDAVSPAAALTLASTTEKVPATGEKTVTTGEKKSTAGIPAEEKKRSRLAAAAVF